LFFAVENRRFKKYFSQNATLPERACLYLYKTWNLELAVMPKKDELIERCLRGDRLGYKELYTRYSKAMYNTCLRMMNNAAEAEDVLQESFIEAFRNLERFENRSSFGSWIKQICINRCINQLNRRRIDWVDMEKIPGFDSADEQPIDEELISFRVETVKRAIMQLPDGYRTVLNLYLLEGYDHEEISEILQVAESTTRTQYMRAKQKLLQLLKEGS
jgi:RNA polymerase sigma factor (sigma-70 family)